MYAHANSTCALGSRMLNGIGGSADFLRNAKVGPSCLLELSLHRLTLCAALHHAHSLFVRRLRYEPRSSSLTRALRSRPTKTDPFGISCIVPFATHIDQTEHDLDVGEFLRCLPHSKAAKSSSLSSVVTEQGLADLRGLSPRQRAPVISTLHSRSPCDPRALNDPLPSPKVRAPALP